MTKEYSLTWLPDVLRAAGLNVQETPNWRTRGHGDMGKVLGVLCHHTCGPKTGNMRDLQVLIDGRPDLPGPLSQLGLGRDGTVFIVCAGLGYHAGRGSWRGVTEGNSHLIGIEAENTGESDPHTGDPLDPWPVVQMDAYMRTCAAILRHVGADPAMCVGHKEYALPHGRKDDPNFGMGPFRARVAEIMGQLAVMPPPVVVASNIRHGVVNTDGLSVRQSASASSKLLRSLKRGNEIVILGEEMNGTTKWLKIGDGYVAARFVDQAV